MFKHNLNPNHKIIIVPQYHGYSKLIFFITKKVISYPLFEDIKGHFLCYFIMHNETSFKNMRFGAPGGSAD